MEIPKEGVKPGEGPPPVSPPAPENQPNPAEATPRSEEVPADGGVTPPDELDDGKRVVSTERFNQLLDDSKKLKTLETDFASSKQDMANKLDAIAAAASGKSPEEKNDLAATLSAKWNLPGDFTKELLDVATSQATASMEERLRPLQAQQAQGAYSRELNKLKEDFPAAADMTADELTAFKAKAMDPKYIKVPLEELWKIQSFGTPEGRAKTAEPSRGGARSPGAGGDDVDIASMSLDEFKEFSEKMAKGE